MQKFTDAFGVMPLRTVEFRADPVLYKQQGYVDHLKFYRSDGELWGKKSGELLVFETFESQVALSCK